MVYRVIRPAKHKDRPYKHKNGVGSFEVGTIIGVNHFDTSFKLWQRKTGNVPIAYSEAMELGIASSQLGQACSRREPEPSYMRIVWGTGLQPVLRRITLEFPLTGSTMLPETGTSRTGIASLSKRPHP